jgi:rhamnosyltransferase
MIVTQAENVPTDALATVAVLTYNGETYLEQILMAVEGQSLDGDIDILVIDSGSTDRTLDIVSRHPRVRLHQIPNSEFGHGRTRNLAARLARGEFIAYLTHDAIPASDRWLQELLAPLRDTHADIAAVMGKQIPRPGCFPLLKYEIQGVFAGFGPDFGTTVFFDDGTARGDQALLDALSFYSDVNSATRTAFLRHEIPYRDVRYSEDMMFGQDIIEAGYKKAYAPRGAVVHSNDLTLDEYGKRMFDETVALRQIGKPIPPMRRRAQLRMTVRGVLADTIRILRDDYSAAGKLRWLLVNPRFHIAKWRAYRAASRVDLADDAAIRAGSLEHSRTTQGDS